MQDTCSSLFVLISIVSGILSFTYKKKEFLSKEPYREKAIKFVQYSYTNFIFKNMHTQAYVYF
jgi:hypothetical protein